MNNIVLFFFLILTIGKSRVNSQRSYIYIYWISVAEVQASLLVDQAIGEVLRVILLVACSLGEAGV